MHSLADAILAEDIGSVTQLLYYGADVNQIDEYGFTPLIEAAIIENLEITKLLLQKGAQINGQDLTGGTALHWSSDNNNLELSNFLLSQGANPNAYNFSGEPVLSRPLLKQYKEMKNLLVKAGAQLDFAHDFNNVKLLGHMYELVGKSNIYAPDGKFVEVDFEGFFLEVTLSLVSNSLLEFQNHYAARQMRRFSAISNYIVGLMHNALALLKYKHYRINRAPYREEILRLMQKETLIIPVAYEGHAITFIKKGNLWVKCDRREDSRLFDNIMIYEIQNMQQFNFDLLEKLYYIYLSSEFINQDLDRILDLKPITEIKVEAQISGNCSWANVEALIPAAFFLAIHDSNQAPNQYHKSLALNFFHHWREWNKDRSLNICLQSFKDSPLMRKATKAEALAAILFQRCKLGNVRDEARIKLILNALKNSPYAYVLNNYLKIFYVQNNTEEGKNFHEILKHFDYLN